jgi:hypothetical protein
VIRGSFLAMNCTARIAAAGTAREDERRGHTLAQDMLFFRCRGKQCYGGQIRGESRFPMRRPAAVSSDNRAVIEADLLHGLEDATEQVRVLSELARILIEAMQRGETLPAAVLAQYATSLESIDQNRERMQELIAAFWQTMPNERKH